MIVSLSWLKEYIEIPLSPLELSERLTMAGLEVEGIERPYDFLKNVVVAKVISITKHPNADHLMICQVDLGKEKVQVVCSAPNLKAGIKVPMALPGTTMPNGMTIGITKLKGEVSNGMLCSEKELKLGEDESGLMILDESYKVGTSLLDALDIDDVIFELGVTPNRPDWLSMIGVAREISALLKLPYHMPETIVHESGEDITTLTEVKNEAPELCPRYTARLIQGIKVRPSPPWLKRRLSSVGIRSINNVVDVTNFVLMELGQPLHAFDFELLEERRIVIKKAGANITFTTLDGVKRALNPSSLMICDGKKPIALAGIMGGENSEIHTGTTQVLLESAYFHPPHIRMSSKQYGIRSESSYRFERGVDPKGVVTALNRAAILIQKLAGGTIAQGIIDHYPKPIGSPTIHLSTKMTNKRLGFKLDQKEIKTYLQNLHMQVEAKKDNDTLCVIPPSFRRDINRPIDLIEEVARIHGYDQIPVTLPKTEIKASVPYQHQVLRNQLLHAMASLGFLEIINYSFISPVWLKNLNLATDSDLMKTVSIKNPLSEDQSIMRTSLVPGILNTMLKNLNHKNLNLRLFEIGKVFFSNNKELPDEKEMLIALITGRRWHSAWCGKDEMVDFLDLKGVLEALFEQMAAPAPELRATGDIPYFDDTQQARIFIKGTEVGEIGNVSQKVKASFDLKQDSFIFQLDLNKMMPFVLATPKFKHIPRYPAVERDISIVVDEEIEWVTISTAIHNLKTPILEKVELFDVFRDPKKIGPGKKSLAISLIFRSKKKTLEDREVNDIVEQIIETLSKVVHATLRA